MKSAKLLFVAVAVALLAAGCSRGDVEEITILHWNDFHAQNRPFVDLSPHGNRALVGGAARFAYVLDSLRHATKNPVALHAGDEFSGSAECTITKGASQIRLLNLLRPAAFELGNHEFDYGPARLKELLQQARFPVVCGNLWDKAAGAPFDAERVRPYVILRAGKARIGVIGVVTPRFGAVTRPGSKLQALDPAKVVLKWAKAIADSVDLTVVLSHMGVKDDRKLVERLPRGTVDVIVGGHSHTVLEHPEVLNGVLICQAGCRGEFVGELHLKVDLEGDSLLAHKGKLVRVTDPGKEDPAVAAFVDSLFNALDATYHLTEVIAQLKGDWIRAYGQESAVGDWEADVFRKVSGADVAFQNNGGIRKDLPEGPIRVADFWELNPFSNRLVTFTVTGAELLDILDYNAEAWSDILQLSGVRVHCDARRPRGHRIIRATLADGRPIRRGRRYKVCTNDYVAKHFYQYFGIPPRGRKITDLGIIDRDAFIQEAKRQKVIVAKTDGRLVIDR
ncbi:MAG: bifunctional metallophosphatase/5'-nucleotidase [Calditrichaeota bacterium]|nr:bifunctional metallophosphatase/5'-nucleotidase [Calditrichota bacterium]